MSYCTEFFKGIACQISDCYGYSYYLKDGKLLYVDGYENISLLSNDNIVLSAKRVKIEIVGGALRIERIDGQSMVISGKIEMIKTQSRNKNE